jgi:hypothetical protein
LIYLFPLKSYSAFSFWLEILIGAEILAVFVNYKPLVHQRDPRKAPIASNRVV